jgi:5-methylcytosine-specific restriction protein A
MRVDEPPRERPELDTEQRYWREPDTTVQHRVVGTLTHRDLGLTADRLRGVAGLERLPVFHGFQQGTNFPVGDAEGDVLLDLIRSGVLPEPAPPPVSAPSFEVGRVYDRRADIHGPYGGQQQGGISTPTRARCVFLFTGPAGAQHGYLDDWNEDGVFLYSGEGQSGDMEFTRGNLAIRDHARDGRDLHLFRGLGKGNGYRYAGRFDCAGWEFRRGPDTAGQDRRVIVFHLLPESDEEEPEQETGNTSGTQAVSLAVRREQAYEAVRPPGERPTRESRRLYYDRSAAVRAYVLGRAAGVCESCRRPAPFVRPSGTPYLEPHHTRRVADGGPDHPRWVGAVCPNCHSEVHHGRDGPEVNARLEEYLGTTEEDDA